MSSTPHAVSSSMSSSRAAGYSLSSGTYAPPAFSTPSTATTISKLRSRHTPTSTSGPTPCFRSQWASRFARSFSTP